MSSVLQGDCIDLLPTLPAASVQCVVTSPPYWGLRDYGCNGQLGMERTPELYIERMVDVFREVRRVLRRDGTLWLNMGDCYAASVNGAKHDPKSPRRPGANGRADDRTFRDKPFATIVSGLKPKDLVGMPWMLALALRADGWWLRSDIVWNKPNPMPESVMDRPTKSHEYLFLMSKSLNYYYDAEAIREPDTGGDHARNVVGPVDSSGGFLARHAGIRTNDGRNGDGRNRRSVWTIATQPYPDAHFATFPEDLVKPCILAGSRPGDTVLDPFAGSGTTLAVAKLLNREFIGIELNAAYLPLIDARLAQEVLAFGPGGSEKQG